MRSTPPQRFHADRGGDDDRDHRRRLRRDAAAPGRRHARQQRRRRAHHRHEPRRQRPRMHAPGSPTPTRPPRLTGAPRTARRASSSTTTSTTSTAGPSPRPSIARRRTLPPSTPPGASRSKSRSVKPDNLCHHHDPPEADPRPPPDLPHARSRSTTTARLIYTQSWIATYSDPFSRLDLCDLRNAERDFREREMERLCDILRRNRRGVTSVLAMLYLVLFSCLAVGFYAARNHRRAGLQPMSPRPPGDALRRVRHGIHALSSWATSTSPQHARPIRSWPSSATQIEQQLRWNRQHRRRRPARRSPPVIRHDHPHDHPRFQRHRRSDRQVIHSGHQATSQVTGTGPDPHVNRTSRSPTPGPARQRHLRLRRRQQERDHHGR